MKNVKIRRLRSVYFYGEKIHATVLRTTSTVIKSTIISRSNVGSDIYNGLQTKYKVLYKRLFRYKLQEII
jgi:hypothetical protein